MARMAPDELEIVSRDGTKLSVRAEGTGSPLVLVHGTAANKEAWALLVPLLAERHTVWSYDRRGRGQSGDATTYDAASEVDDVRAVVEAAGHGAHLFGHSFGAYCALDAATSNIECSSLILYEIPAHQDRRADAVERALRRFDAGDDEAALLLLFAEVVGLSDDEVALLRSVPDIWNDIVLGAPTVRREVKMLATRAWNTDAYRSIDAPVLYISGALTDSPVYLSHRELIEAVPHAAHAILGGQRHIAMVTDPQALATVVLDFIANVDEQRSRVPGARLSRRTE
jgi:pimeloyl-ACP methyl ester carboxylesterase